MEMFKEVPKVDFIGLRRLAMGVSLAVLGGGCAVLLVRGLNWGIDFTGGSVAQIRYRAPQTLAALREEARGAGFGDAILQEFTGAEKPTFSVRLKGTGPQSAEAVEKLLAGLRETAPGKEFDIEQKEFVGPTVGRHLFKQAAFAVTFSLLGIIAYVAFRFSNPVWGVAGLLALGHDVLAMLGLFAVLRMEVDLVMVAAVLTIAGYSINDTIVIFDRMRERMRMMRREPLAVVINASVNETLSRTLMTSGLVLLTVLALLFFGGSAIHDFALAMTCGMISGSWSTIAIAAPLVYEWEEWRRRADSSGARAAGPDAPAAGAPDSDALSSGKRERRKRRHEEE